MQESTRSIWRTIGKIFVWVVAFPIMLTLYVVIGLAKRA